jgi:hypothetical protein
MKALVQEKKLEKIKTIDIMMKKLLKKKGKKLLKILVSKKIFRYLI